MLNYTTEKIISLNDWDNLVKETYNKPYSFQQQNGCQPKSMVQIYVPHPDSDEIDAAANDRITEEINGKEYGVKLETWLNRDRNKSFASGKEIRFLELFWERNFYPHIEVLCTDLFKKGLLEKGTYKINIDW